MKLIQLLLLSVLVLSSSCKDTPTFPAENPNDPESGEYDVPSPLNPTLTFDPEVQRYQVSWGLPDDTFTGTIIERLNSPSNSFVKVETAPKTVTAIAYTPASFYLNEQILIKNYHINSSGDTLFSVDKKLTYQQSITGLSAYMSENNEVTLSWQHSLVADEAELIIMRSENMVSEQIARLPISDSTFTDPTPIDVLTVTTYTLFAADTLFESHRQTATLGQDGVSPVSSVDLIDETSSRITFEIGTDSNSDSLLIELESVNSDQKYTKLVKTHQSGITMVGLDNVNAELAPYTFSVFNRKFGVSSAPYNTVLKSTLVIEPPLKTALPTEISPYRLHFVNNGEHLAYIKQIGINNSVGTPSLLDLNTIKVTHTFSGDTSSYSLDYNSESNRLYANQPKGLLEIDLNSNSERYLNRPDALINSDLLHLNKHSDVAYLLNTRYNIAMLDLETLNQVGILDSNLPRTTMSFDDNYLFAYSDRDQKYDVYRTIDHSIVYSSTDKIDSLHILPDVFFGGNEMLLWSKYFGLYHLNLESLEYSFISDNPTYGKNNFSGYFNNKNRNFYSLYRGERSTYLAIWDIQSKKIIQQLNLSSKMNTIEAEQAELIFNYDKNKLYAFSNFYMFEFPTAFSWSIDD